jgi:hypothetical protein
LTNYAAEAQVEALLGRLSDWTSRGENSGEWRVTFKILMNDAEFMRDSHFAPDSKDYRLITGALNTHISITSGSSYLKYVNYRAIPLWEALQVVKHRLEQGQSVTSTEEPNETMIGAGTPHSAYVGLRDLIEGAEREVFIVDPYVDRDLFPLLTNAKKAVSVRILTRRSRSLPTDFVHEASKFSKEHKIDVWVRLGLKDDHDRFLLVDDRLYASGASFKQLGDKLSVVLPITTIHLALARELNDRWELAEPLTPVTESGPPT